MNPSGFIHGNACTCSALGCVRDSQHTTGLGWRGLPNEKGPPHPKKCDAGDCFHVPSCNKGAPDRSYGYTFQDNSEGTEPKVSFRHFRVEEYRSHADLEFIVNQVYRDLPVLGPLVIRIRCPRCRKTRRHELKQGTTIIPAAEWTGDHCVVETEFDPAKEFDTK